MRHSLGRLTLACTYCAVSFPIAWLVYLSLQSSNGLNGLHADLTVQPWLRFVSSPFLRATANSILVSAITALAAVSLGLLVASRLSIPGTPRRLRAAIGDTLLFARILPIAVLTPAIIWILRPAGLVDVAWVPIVLYLPGLAVIPTVICSLALRRISSEHLDMMRVEAWTAFQSYRFLIIPLATPHLVASFMICYCVVWNEFLLQTLMTDTTPRQTLTVMLANAIGQYSIDYPLLAAGGLVSLLPALLVTAWLSLSHSLRHS